MIIATQRNKQINSGAEQTDTKYKSGVYCWINLLDGKYYIGSSLNLNNKINDYFQDWYYKDRTNVIIVRAILKYGLGNFALLILDCLRSFAASNEKENTLVKEQFWLDKLKPDYNILTQADNSTGFKHSTEIRDTLVQSRNRTSDTKGFRTKTLRRGSKGNERESKG